MIKRLDSWRLFSSFISVFEDNEKTVYDLDYPILQIRKCLFLAFSHAQSF